MPHTQQKDCLTKFVRQSFSFLSKTQPKALSISLRFHKFIQNMLRIPHIPEKECFLIHYNHVKPILS